MVQMKAVFLEGTSLLVALYIPHGSDESLKNET